MVPELLILALDFHRSPLRYRHLTETSQPLPKAFDTLLTGLAAAVSPQNIDATAARLGKEPARIEEAARFFIRQVLLAPGADHYRVLGLSRGATAATIREHYHLLVRLFHPDRSKDETELDATLTARINEAYNALRDPTARRRYDKTLAGVAGGRKAEPDPRALFRPSGPVLAEATSRGRAAFLQRRLLRGLAWALLGFTVVVLIYALFRVATKPVLRANPDAGTGIDAMPSYLRGEVSSPVSATPGPAAPDVDAAAERAEPEALDPAASDPTLPSAGSSLGGGPSSERLTREQIRNGILDGLARSPWLAAAPEAVRDADDPLSGPRDHQKGSVKRNRALETKARSVAAAKEETSAPPTQAADRDASVVPVEPAPRVRKDKTSVPAGQATALEAPAGPIEPQPLAPVESAASAVPSQAAAPLETKSRDVTPRKPPTRVVHRPDGLLRRFAQAYASGDLASFVALFTRDAQVNDGRGIAFIRSDYASFFARTPERRLQFRHVRWEAATDTKVLVNAQVQVWVRDRASSKWRKLGGTIEFELSETGQGLKISRMLHALEPL